MKKLVWFTHTNIDTRKVRTYSSGMQEEPKVVFDLTPYLEIFRSNRIWERKKYRTEYVFDYSEENLAQIKSVKIYLYSHNAPYSNGHSYENVIKAHIDLDKLELSKITSSGIGEAAQIAVIETEFESNHKIIDYLSHEEEKDVEVIFERRLTEENTDSWYEMARIKSIVCEFIQFYSFNLHLSFLSHRYSFSFTEKPIHTGFTIVTDSILLYYETDKIDLLAHYVLYEPELDRMKELMDKTSQFWHKEIPSIHFFLDSLRGSHMTINNFSKLVFALESFFGKNSSNDFMTLSIPLLLGDSIHTMKEVRKILQRSFTIRNDYVHGKGITDLNSVVSGQDKTTVYDIFFQLKNTIINVFHFYLENNLYTTRANEKINHELLFRLFPKGLGP